MSVDIPRTFGALLMGGLSATLLSGIVSIQLVLYFKLYPEDDYRNKIVVVTTWILDLFHTILIWMALWRYFIDNYANPSTVDEIHWNLSLSILITAVLTLLVHLFLIYRIFMLSRCNYFITAPILLFATLRIVSGSVTTVYLIKLQSFVEFQKEIGWNITTGLTLSALVDILVAVSLIHLLQKDRSGTDSTNMIIDSLIRYTFETGSLTCVGAIATLLFWVLSPGTLIFMGLHFLMSKFYANSLLVTLNSRQCVRQARSRASQSGGEGGLAVHVLDSRRNKRDSSEQVTFSLGSIRTEPIMRSSKIQAVVEVNVERNIQFDA